MPKSWLQKAMQGSYSSSNGLHWRAFKGDEQPSTLQVSSSSPLSRSAEPASSSTSSSLGSSPKKIMGRSSQRPLRAPPRYMVSRRPLRDPSRSFLRDRSQAASLRSQDTVGSAPRPPEQNRALSPPPNLAAPNTGKCLWTEQSCPKPWAINKLLRVQASRSDNPFQLSQRLFPKDHLDHMRLLSPNKPWSQPHDARLNRAAQI